MRTFPAKPGGEFRNPGRADLENFTVIFGTENDLQALLPADATTTAAADCFDFRVGDFHKSQRSADDQLIFFQPDFPGTGENRRQADQAGHGQCHGDEHPRPLVRRVGNEAGKLSHAYPTRKHDQQRYRDSHD